MPVSRLAMEDEVDDRRVCVLWRARGCECAEPAVELRWRWAAGPEAEVLGLGSS